MMKHHCALAIFVPFLAASLGCTSRAPEGEGEEKIDSQSAPIVAPEAGEPAAAEPPASQGSQSIAGHVPHGVPPLSKASHVHAFVEWASASTPDEREDVRQAIGAAKGNGAVVQALVQEVHDAHGVDHSRTLIGLAILGEMRAPSAEAFLKQFANGPLPETGTVVEGDILEQTAEATLQGKAVDGLAYMGTPSADAEVLRIVAKHSSKYVRAEAIEAYLWNHGDSPAARAKLAKFVRSGEEILLERVRRVDGEGADAFNAKLNAFLTAHPELIPPIPAQAQAHTPKNDVGAPFNESPPPF